MIMPNQPSVNTAPSAGSSASRPKLNKKHMAETFASLGNQPINSQKKMKVKPTIIIALRSL